METVEIISKEKVLLAPKGFIMLTYRKYVNENKSEIKIEKKHIDSFNKEIYYRYNEERNFKIYRELKKKMKEIEKIGFETMEKENYIKTEICIICMDSLPYESAFFNCRHKCLCYKCHRKLLKEECPLCRAKIIDKRYKKIIIKDDEVKIDHIKQLIDEVNTILN